MDNTPEAILKVALAKEEVAFRFYSDLIVRHSKVQVVRDLLERLKDEEHQHIKLIESKIAQLASGRL